MERTKGRNMIKDYISHILGVRRMTALDEFNPYTLPKVKAYTVKTTENGKYPSLSEKLMMLDEANVKN